MRHCNSRQKIWLGNGIFIIWSLLYPYASALIAQPITPSRNLWPAKAATIEGQPLQTPQALWEKQKEVLKDAMKTVMGPLPSKPLTPPKFTLLEEVDAGSYIRRLIEYETDPGAVTPAFLCIPKRALMKGAQLPAALCLHPTDDRVGHRVVLGLGGRPGREYAHELAERGWVTLAPAYPLLAQYQPDLDQLGYLSGSMKAISDNRRGVDLLETLPFVQPGGFAAIGHSLGGHNAIFTAVWDERIKVVVSSCGFDRFVDYKGGDIRGWTSRRYMPRLLDHPINALPFDFDQLIASLAPRSIFISAPVEDDNFRVESVREIVKAVQPVFKNLGKPAGLKAVYPLVGHDFPMEVRLEAYAFMEEALAAHR